MIHSEPIDALGAVQARHRISRHDRSSEPVAGPWLARGAEASPPPLVPLLAADDDLTPEVDRALTKVALVARAGDRAARDALYTALAAKIARFVARYTAWDRARRGQWRDGRPWHAEDLAHDGYVTLVDLIAAWTGDGSFGHFFFTAFPWRLRDIADQETGPWTRQLAGGGAELRLVLLADDSAAAEEALAVLEALAADLPAADGDLLRWHIRDRHSLVAIARRLGVTPRTVRRRWAELLTALRPTFGGPEPGRASTPDALPRRHAAPEPPLQ